MAILVLSQNLYLMQNFSPGGWYANLYIMQACSPEGWYTNPISCGWTCLMWQNIHGCIHMVTCSMWYAMSDMSNVRHKFYVYICHAQEYLIQKYLI